MLMFCIYSSKHGEPGMLYLLSATGNGMMKCRVSSSMVGLDAESHTVKWAFLSDWQLLVFLTKDKF